LKLLAVCGDRFCVGYLETTWAMYNGVNMVLMGKLFINVRVAGSQKTKGSEVRGMEYLRLSFETVESYVLDEEERVNKSTWMKEKKIRQQAAAKSLENFES
jgi:hypothetical protein